jgi:hypothetical protein
MNPKQSTEKNVIERLYSIPGLNYGDSSPENKHLDAISILSLPNHLRKTALAIHKVSKGNPSKISKITGNNHNVESNNLEELVDMGYLRKKGTELEIYYELIKGNFCTRKKNKEC